jgi:hypothetical protein
VVYVACEGERTEVDYLYYLNEQFGRGAAERPPFRLIPLARKNGLSPLATVEYVLAEAGEDDEKWALFDRDGRDRDQEIPKAVRLAAKKRVEVGFSHPAFDLWLLLHFQAFTGREDGRSDAVIRQLRRVPAFEKYDSHNDKSVRGPRREALRDKNRERDAVRHAKKLVDQCEGGQCSWKEAATEPGGEEFPVQTPQKWMSRSGHSVNCEPLKRDPSTDMWRLLVSLGLGLA